MLNSDKHLWARTYRIPYIEKFSILDVSLHQRNAVVEKLATQHCDRSQEFIGKEFMQSLARVEQSEFVYSHEFRVLNNQQSLVV